MVETRRPNAALMKHTFFKHLMLAATLAVSNANADATSSFKYAIKEIKAPDTKSLLASGKLIADLGIVIEAQEVQKFIKEAFESCISISQDIIVDRDPLICPVLDNLISVAGAYHYTIIQAAWSSGQCGTTGLCTTVIFDTIKKRIVYKGDTFGVVSRNGKLYMQDINGKPTLMELN